MSEYAKVSDMVGETVASVEVGPEMNFMKFTMRSGNVFTLAHEQDCCEYVRIIDINGDPQSMVGRKIMSAVESSSTERPADRPPRGEWDESETWTFYKFRTNAGYVDVRWQGESNGYYSESVDITVDKPT